MRTEALLPRSGRGLQEAINGFLAALLENGVVDALLVPTEVPSGRNVTQALVRDAARLVTAVPVSPVMPVNSATVVSNLTIDRGAGTLGVVLRSCEIRALVELVKLKQVSLERVRIIGVDCAGSYAVPDYAAMVDSLDGATSARPSGAPVASELASDARPSEASSDATTSLPRAHRFVELALERDEFRWDGYQLRAACRMCERPTPRHGDVSIGFLGLSSWDALAVELSEEVAAVGLDRLGLVEGRAEGRQEAVDRLVRRREEALDAAFDEVRRATGSPDGLLGYFAACLTCHNCSVTCPICYCKQCVFTTSTFEHSSSQYLRRAARKGALRMPADTLLYHLTRMNHMATSCVGCGQCESGCPSRIPLTALFRGVARRVQALYDYVPGRSLEEEPPVATFREDELSAVAR